MIGPLFHLDGESFVPTELCRGGWDDRHQHGSPPSLLLARALEQIATPGPMQPVRFTIDLFRPVPLAPLHVTTDVVREGRRLQVTEARLSSGNVELGRASLLRLRITDIPDLPDAGVDLPHGSLPAPEEAPANDWAGRFGDRGALTRFHLDAIEIRTFDDSFVRPGEGRSWIRLCAAVVDDEAATPFLQVVGVADVGNGNSQNLDPHVWLYVNADITLSLHRLPTDGWIGMRSIARQHPTGIGVAETRLVDRNGAIGAVLQSQLVERH